LAFASAVAIARDPSCGGTDSPASGVNAPCTRDKDCADGLSCEHGVCTQGDAGAAPDAQGDAQGDADQAPDAPNG
jgi:hypothetical protein